MNPVVCQGSWLACNYQWLVGSVVIPLIGINAALSAVLMAYRSIKNDNKLATEDRQNQARPAVAPSGQLSHHNPKDGSVNWDPYYNLPAVISPTGGSSSQKVPNTQELVLQNVGDGTAFNVHCFLYGPGGRLKLQQNYTSWNNGPIPGKGKLPIVFEHGGTVLPENTKVDGENVLYDDSKPDRLIARLTITYHDLLKIKHVSIFDYVLYKYSNHTKHQWLHVGTKNGISFDLNELQ